MRKPKSPASRKAHLDANSPPTAEVRRIPRHPIHRTRTYAPQEVVEEKFQHLREAQKMTAVQQAFDGTLTADKGQIRGGRIWLGWLMYPICTLPLTWSADL